MMCSVTRCLCYPLTLFGLLQIVTGSVPALIADTPDVSQVRMAPITTSAGMTPLRMMHLLTKSTGWALVGDHLEWTETSGKEWADITPPLTNGQSISSVFFLTPSMGWSLLQASPSDGPTKLFVASTMNAGKTWLVDAFTAASPAFLLPTPEKRLLPLWIARSAG